MVRPGMIMLLLILGIAWGPLARASDSLVAYRMINGAIPEPLTTQPGDPERGRLLVMDREAGDCVICHAMPLPHRQFHGTVGPPLDGVGSRSSEGQLRLRLVDPKVIHPQTIMPAYYKVEGLYRVLDRYQGKPLLTAQQIEDVVAYLLTLQHE
jgi:L-cysteine S-thiosulfotransferase